MHQLQASAQPTQYYYQEEEENNLSLSFCPSSLSIFLSLHVFTSGAPKRLHNKNPLIHSSHVF